MSSKKLERILAALSSTGIGAAVYSGLNSYINNILNEMHLKGSYDSSILSFAIAITLSLASYGLAEYAINKHEENKRRSKYLI
ncbi:MAG: hypothetical protein QXT34_03935 [Candidatus Aenigmatarchaeota archaeon]